MQGLRRLDDIGAFIEKDNPDAAARVVARIVAAVDSLADLPGTGRVGRIKGTREIVLTDIPYIIPYRVGRDIEIITVMHAHQKWPRCFRSGRPKNIAVIYSKKSRRGMRPENRTHFSSARSRAVCI
ncbi:RelE/StbE family addiction module toxin [Sinorhizobium meliloti CCBAU 01290]|nr:RelE/StbE family addiction module toxin [Sinorhizobium meliloti CCBAU 01290]